METTEANKGTDLTKRLSSSVRAGGLHWMTGAAGLVHKFGVKSHIEHKKTYNAQT